MTEPTGGAEFAHETRVQEVVSYATERGTSSAGNFTTSVGKGDDELRFGRKRPRSNVESRDRTLTIRSRTDVQYFESWRNFRHWL
jgi:hypothetical protein